MQLNLVLDLDRNYVSLTYLCNSSFDS